MDEKSTTLTRDGGLILAGTIWLVAIAAFVVLFVLDVSRWVWLGHLAIGGLVVALIGFIRLKRVPVGAVRRSFFVVALCTIFPPLDTYLATLEERAKTIRENETIVANMGETLAAYYLDEIPSAASNTFRWKTHSNYAPVPLDVQTCANAVAKAMVDAKGQPRGLPADETVVGEVLAILYYDRFRPDFTAELSGLWSKRKRALAPHVATVLLCRKKLMGLGVGHGELTDHLKSCSRFSFDDVVSWVSKRPMKVTDRMVHIIDIYKPVHNCATAQGWPPPGYEAGLAAAVNLEPMANKRIGVAATYCASTVTGLNPPSAELFEFLYRRRFEPKTAEWNQRTEKLIPQLADVLAHSNCLPSSAQDFSRSPERLKLLLSQLNDYSLEFVHNEVVTLQRLLDRARRFAEFLSREGIKHDVVVEPDGLLDWIETLPTGTHNLARLSNVAVTNDILARVGKLVISAYQASRPANAKQEPLTRQDKADLALVTVGEFFVTTNEGPPGAETAIARKVASASSPASVLSGLLQLRERSEGTSVRLHRILDEFADLLKKAGDDPAPVSRVTQWLRSGNWPTRCDTEAPPASKEELVAVVESLAGKMSPDIGNLQRELSTLSSHVKGVEQFERQKLKPKLAQLQRQVGKLVNLSPDIGTLKGKVSTLSNHVEGVEQFERCKLEPELTNLVDEQHATGEGIARLRDMLIGVTCTRPNDLDKRYLITYDTHTGPLSPLLDALTTINEPVNEPLRTLCKPNLKEVVERAKSGYYNFGHFTRYARVGSLPDGQDFDQFARQFFCDLQDLIAVTEGETLFGKMIEWDQVRITIIRLGLARYDFRHGSLQRTLRAAGSGDEDELKNRRGSAVAAKPLQQPSPVGA